MEPGCLKKILWQKAAFIGKEKSRNTFLTVLMQYNTAGLIEKELVGYQFDLKTLYNALAYTSFWFSSVCYNRFKFEYQLQQIKTRITV